MVSILAPCTKCGGKSFRHERDQDGEFDVCTTCGKLVDVWNRDKGEGEEEPTPDEIEDEAAEEVGEWVEPEPVEDEMEPEPEQPPTPPHVAHLECCVCWAKYPSAQGRAAHERITHKLAKGQRGIILSGGGNVDAAEPEPPLVKQPEPEPESDDILDLMLAEWEKLSALHGELTSQCKQIEKRRQAIAVRANGLQGAIKAYRDTEEVELC